MSPPAEAQLLDELRATFTLEARGRVERLGQLLVRLEDESCQDEWPAALNDLLREAHSLKGAARSVGNGHVQDLAHRLETAFGSAGEGSARPDPAGFDLSYGIVDAIAADIGAKPAGGVTAIAQSAAQETADVELAPRPAAMQPAPSAGPAAEDSIRIGAGRLDALIADAGQLHTVLATLAGASNAVRDLWTRDAGHDRLGRGYLAELDGVLHRAQTLVSTLESDLHAARMLPLATIFAGLPRTVRDLAHTGQKKVTLKLEGEDVEVDRSVLEQLPMVLTHLLRNAVDHGIESPDARRAASKPERGTIEVCAARLGAHLEVRITDDGAGIDAERVRLAAQQRGLIDADSAGVISDRDALELIFRPGVSTSAEVSKVSGRGIGLDAVRTAVGALGGSITVTTEIGRRTELRLELPLSVSTTTCLLARAGSDIVALPAMHGSKVLRLPDQEIKRTVGQPTVALGGELFPVAHLADALRLGGQRPGVRASDAAVLVGSEERAVFLTDGLVGIEDLVVNPIPDVMGASELCTGAAVLSSGEVAITVNAVELARSLRQRGRSISAESQIAPEPEVPRPTVLIAEDSITTRTLEKSILEGAGYRVVLAPDGAAAWRMLQVEACDLLLTDVLMPKMSGLELTEKVRSDQRLKDLPIVVVTSLGEDDQRAQGAAAGANAYIVKNQFDQDDLLATVAQLV